MDEATIVVNKFAENDPEQVRWLAQIRESFERPHVSVVATPWDQSLANRVPLNLGAVAGPTLDAKLAMAEVVLQSVARACRRRLGLPEEETEYSGNGERDPAEPPRWLSEPRPPAAAPDSPNAEPNTPDVQIIPTQLAAHSPAAVPDSPDTELSFPDVRISRVRTESDSTDTEPTVLQSVGTVQSRPSLTCDNAVLALWGGLAVSLWLRTVSSSRTSGAAERLAVVPANWVCWCLCLLAAVWARCCTSVLYGLPH